jgi:geranylgeranyl reductase family protein
MVQNMANMNKTEVFDVCIVGAGIAGSTCAFYLAKQGKSVLLLEKEKFPRDKICGDAITPRAQVHLKRMGVLKSVLEEKKGHWAKTGGLLSPGGIRYSGNSAVQAGSPLVIAIKRIILDEKMARAAVNAGAELVENYPVRGAEFSSREGMWTVHSDSSANPSFRSRVLVTADGANSRLARSLGIVTTGPTAICSRSYVEAGTFQFKEDGVCFYRPSLVPGYFSMFRQADGDLGLCCYIVPGGRSKIGDLKKMHHSLIKEDPFISEELGSGAKMEKMKAGFLRIEAVSESYSDHLLIVGDAAGQIDPLTGEGIQYAMDGGEIAAEVLGEAFLKNDLSKQYLKRYHKRCMKSFGRDFKWSSRMAKWFTRHPVFLDAFAALCERRGDAFMLKWAYIMTGSKPKRHFFRPGMALPLLFESFRHRRVYRKD